MAMKRFLPSVLLASALICVVFGVYQISLRYGPSVGFHSVEEYPTNANILTTSIQPIRLAIPSIGVDLPIVSSKIRNGRWETTTSAVSYLSASPVPGMTGNSILYGHNWPVLLGNLDKVKPGDTIRISYAPNHTETFTVIYEMIVDPGNLSVLTRTSDRRITLYTCAGFLDSKRLVITALADSDAISVLPTF
jgi:sortase A